MASGERKSMVYQPDMQPKKRDVQGIYVAGAREAIGQIAHDVELFVFSKGQFSLVDALAHLLEQTGPADVDISTWTIGMKSLDKLHHLLSDGSIIKIRVLLDRSYGSRKPECRIRLCDALGDENIRVTMNHSKFIIMRNGAFLLSILTSMNLNTNKRLEYVAISGDAGLVGFLTGVFDEWFQTCSTALTFDSPHEVHTKAFKQFGRGVDGERGANIDLGALSSFRIALARAHNK